MVATRHDRPAVKWVTLLAMFALCWAASVEARAQAKPDLWEATEAILERIQAPSFPDRNYPITDFDSKAGGSVDTRAAIQAAIDRCSSEGGGRVVVPEGAWLCNGPLKLKSNVDLHLEEGARIEFGANPKDYLPAVLTRWEGTELYTYSPLVHAVKVENVAISGKGTIDGNAKEGLLAAPNKGRGASDLRRMGGEGVPVEERQFGEGFWVRPPLVQFFDCKNILVEGVTLEDSPFWVIHPVYCTNVTVRGVTVNSHNGNNDACDPDSSSDVLIENCVFDTRDDDIAIKSGRDADGWRVGRPSENIIVRNNTMSSRWSALCIGSEMSGGVRNVFMENCVVKKGVAAVYFKSNKDRGGVVENINVRNIKVENVDHVVEFTNNYHGYRGGNKPSVFRDVVIEDITCENAKTAFLAEGAEGAPLQNIVIRNVAVQTAEKAQEIKLVENFKFENVTVNGKPIELEAGEPATAAP